MKRFCFAIALAGAFSISTASAAPLLFSMIYLEIGQVQAKPI
jgi:hypothetical protein